MKKIAKWFSDNLSWLVVLGVGLLCTGFIAFGTPSENGFITLNGKDAIISDATKEWITQANIEYGEHIKAIMTINGKDEEISVPTVESIDGVKTTDDTYTGKGLYAPIGSPLAFKEFTLNKCFDIDGSYGGQCWDLGALFWTNYTGRSLNTCGSGAAKGTIQNGCWQKNAGSEFDMIWNPKDLQAGDWVVFTNGEWGHIGMALGGYNNGYITLLGQNQGGGACSGGGAATNIININLGNFGGAFRPKIYEKPAPTPIPEPISKCESWNLVKGDTLSKIMLACEGYTVYGDTMNEYAKQWTDEQTGKTVWEGWNTYPGIGLYAGHTIIRQ